MTKLHHVQVEIDRETGEWFVDTCEYLGMVDALEFRQRMDTNTVHYDECDPETSPDAAKAIRATGREVGRDNIALTCIFMD
jgi:hypothetical protein